MDTKKILSALTAGAMLLSAMSLAAVADGNVSEWDGVTVDTAWYEDVTATEYILSDADDLAGLASLVNSGTSFSGKTVKLAANVDLAKGNWTPIGGDDASKPFSGTFDGQNYTIKNMTITRENTTTKTRLGLFSEITNATIKNLTIENAKITTNGSDVRGAVLVMTAEGTKNTISDIAIKNGDVTVVSGSNGYAAGMLGYSNTSIDMSNISVDGLKLSVESTSEVRAASVVTYIAQADSGVSTLDNFNIKNVEITAKSTTTYVGGVAADISKGNQNKVGIGFTNGTVENVVINSSATSTSNVGGLIGMTYKVDPQKVNNVTITGLDIDFSGSGSKVGGVVGWEQSVSYDNDTKQGYYSNVSVAGAINEDITSGSGSEVGGFVGVSHQYPKIYNNCSADVDIITGNRAGGFVGTPCPNGWSDQKDTYISCTASGDVTAPIAGGFVGCAWINNNSNTTLVLDNVTATGAVNGSIHAGGLIGYAGGSGGCSNIIITNSAASETVTGSDNATVGGVVGAAGMASGKTITLNNVDYTGETAIASGSVVVKSDKISAENTFNGVYNGEGIYADDTATAVVSVLAISGTADGIRWRFNELMAETDTTFTDAEVIYGLIIPGTVSKEEISAMRVYAK